MPVFLGLGTGKPLMTGKRNIKPLPSKTRTT